MLIYNYKEVIKMSSKKPKQNRLETIKTIVEILLEIANIALIIFTIFKG